MNLTPYLIRGLATGGQFALVAIGYTMVYGILRLINFAHGDVFMVAGIMMIYLSGLLPHYAYVGDHRCCMILPLTVVRGLLSSSECAYKPAAHRAADVRDDLRHRRQLPAAESGHATSPAAWPKTYPSDIPSYQPDHPRVRRASTKLAVVISPPGRWWSLLVMLVLLAHQPHQGRHGHAGRVQGF